MIKVEPKTHRICKICMKTSTAALLLRKIAARCVTEKHEQKLHAWLCEKIMPHGLPKSISWNSNHHYF